MIPRVSLQPPSTPLADDAIRLVPMEARHVPGFEALLEDDDVRRHTRVPSEPPPDYGKTWLGRYEQGWRDGSRAGFAIESREGEFLELWIDVENPGSERVAERGGYVREGVLRSYWFKEDIRRDFGIWSRLHSDP